MGKELLQGFADPDDFVVENDLLSELVYHRGGCSCFISPPCGDCCNPVTEDEAEYLGWERPPAEQPERQLPRLTWADTKPFDAFARPVIEGHAPIRDWVVKVGGTHA